MKRKFNQIGGSWVVIFPKPILELVNINPTKDEIDMTVVDDKIVITKFKEDK